MVRSFLIIGPTIPITKPKQCKILNDIVRLISFMIIPATKVTAVDIILSLVLGYS